MRLRALEEEGIVERHTYPEVPPRVEYALTAKGEALAPLIDDMRAYGTRWLLGEAGRARRRRLDAAVQIQGCDAAPARRRAGAGGGAGRGKLAACVTSC